MRHATHRRVSRQVESLRRQFAQVEGFPFAHVLSTDLIDTGQADEKDTFRNRHSRL